MKVIILGASLLLLLCGAASARPRDDVMVNAYRCAAHASTRVWLDCYYGAAQPQRAALGLSPAPKSQVELADAPPATGTPQDMATRDEVMGGAGRCAAVAADRAWLDCYYAAANPVRSVLGLALTAGPPPPPEGRPMPVSARPIAPGVTRNDPGFVSRILGAPEIKVVSRMESYSHHGNNFIVTLANGQVWQQTDGDTAGAHWHKEPTAYVVTITGGAFGTYNLSVKGDPGRYKVRRTA